jgi:hypothetical protein
MFLNKFPEGSLCANVLEVKLIYISVRPETRASASVAWPQSVS